MATAFPTAWISAEYAQGRGRQLGRLRDSQLTAMLQPNFPPYGLSWSSAGDLGRAGGLTWTYTNITRGDLFHIWWIFCDDPAYPCGLSLDGPIQVPANSWQLDAVDSDLGSGALVMTNALNILLADGTTPALTGRLTMTITDDGSDGSDGSAAPLTWATVSDLDVPARLAQYGAEITGTAFQVTAIEEVQPAGSATWTPYLDYYDAASTPPPTGSGSGSGSDSGSGAESSFGGSFYDK